jgi:branched-chain amino acid transport system substrate-binding protein
LRAISRRSGGHYPPQFAFDAASGVQLLGAAVKKAGGSDPRKLQQALDTLSALTPNGRYTFSSGDHSGLSLDDVAVMQIQNGKFVPTAWQQQQFKQALPK